MAVVGVPSDSVILDQCDCVGHKPQALHLSAFAHGNLVLCSISFVISGYFSPWLLSTFYEDHNRVVV